MDWTEKRQDIIDRLNSFKRGHIGLDRFFYYEPFSFPIVDENGNRCYNPPSLDKIKEDFQKLYVGSVKDNFRWEFCNLMVYKNTFDEAFQKYTEDLPGAEKTNFIENEIKKILSFMSKNLDRVYFQEHRLFDICDKKTYQSIKLSQNQKLKFLKFYLDEELNQEKRKFLDDFKSDDPYPIFKDNGREIFEVLNSKFVRKRFERVDYSLIYWQMRGKHIYNKVRPSDFLEYLQQRELIEEGVEQLYAEKHGYTSDRLSHYSDILKGI
nr:hypothetical protein [uncultured Draconibacterium sp.]